MNLDENQKKLIASWLNEGLKLSEIQQRIGKDLGLSLTYMEVRLLVDDLRLLPKDLPRTEKPAVGAAAPGSALAAPAAPTALEPKSPPTSPAGGRVTVNVDALARPGALVSGSVTFSDGQEAIWYVDQFGRMAVAPKQTGYKPAAADMQSFQQTLEQELSKLGF